MKHFTLLLLFTLVAITARSQSFTNPDFESWEIIPYDDPDQYWITSNYIFLPQNGIVTASKVTGHASPNAIRLETHKVGSGPSADIAIGLITNSLDDIESGEGGQPYTSQATNITGFYRYNIPVLDTGILLVAFKKNGVVLTYDTFHIKGNQSTFIPFNFALSPMGVTPDTVIIAALSSNLLGGDDSKVENGSWLELDGLQFTGSGTMAPIPDGDFEGWEAKSFETPDTWQRGEDFEEGIEPTVKRSTDKYSGTYAVKLVTAIDYASDSFVDVGSVNQSMNVNTLGVDTIVGYYKYTTPGADTAVMSVSFIDVNGQSLGFVIKNILLPSASYRRFSLPIDPADFTANTVGMRVSFESSSNFGPISGMSLDPVPGSTLLIDNLSIVHTPTGVDDVKKTAVNYTVYPNPAKNVLNIALSAGNTDDANIAITDAKGSVVYQNEHKLSAGNAVSIPVSKLSPGMYFYTITGSNGVVKNKFYKE